VSILVNEKQKQEKGTIKTSKKSKPVLKGAKGMDNKALISDLMGGDLKEDDGDSDDEYAKKIEEDFDFM